MSLKKYLPFENYILITNLSPAEVYRRLADNVAPERPLQLFAQSSNTSKPYEGKISKDSFSISRVINYKNSFLPIINGNISSFVGQTQLNIKMKLASFAMVFMSLWLGIMGLACIVTLLIGIIQIKQIFQTGFSPMLLTPFGAFIFGCLLTVIPFKKESKIAKEFLSSLLNAHEIN